MEGKINTIFENNITCKLINLSNCLSLHKIFIFSSEKSFLYVSTFQLGPAEAIRDKFSKTFSGRFLLFGAINRRLGFWEAVALSSIFANLSLINVL